MTVGTRRVSRALLAMTAAASLALGAAACGDDEESAGGGGGGGEEQVTVGLITKTETNPFFVKMKEGAQAAAKENNVKLLTASGKFDTDNASQVTAHREHDHAGRQGHPGRAGRLQGGRPGDPEGA